MRQKRLGFIGALLVLLVGAVQGSAPAGAQTPAGGERPTVVASFSVLGDLVQNVAGDAIEVQTLVGAGADAHTFEPSPADVATIGEADLVFENGLEFETWLDDIYESSGSQATRVVVSEGLDLLPAGEEGHEEDGHEGEAADEHADDGSPAAEAEGDEHEEDEHAAEGTPGAEAHEDEHGHGEFDPHVWHDVTNAIAMVETIRDALVAADPAAAAVYEENAAAYVAELEELDADVAEQVETLPEERRRLVTSHDTFGYFARRYGFEVVGTALGSVSTEVGDPSAGDIAALVEEIREAGVPAIFAENVQNPDLMESIAAEAGVELAPTLYTDALGEPGSEGDTYVGMIRHNVDTIVSALGR
jgi:ABC-type Zn uptake system ZnuABC Zn-binding protein ZnuA